MQWWRRLATVVNMTHDSSTQVVSNISGTLWRSHKMKGFYNTSPVCSHASHYYCSHLWLLSSNKQCFEDVDLQLYLASFCFSLFIAICQYVFNSCSWSWRWYLRLYVPKKCPFKKLCNHPNAYIVLTHSKLGQRHVCHFVTSPLPIITLFLQSLGNNETVFQPGHTRSAVVFMCCL